MVLITPGGTVALYTQRCASVSDLWDEFRLVATLGYDQGSVEADLRWRVEKKVSTPSN
jgi:hypothetical protein